MAGVPKVAMPDRGGSTGEECVGSERRHRWMEGVERPQAIAPGDHVPGTKILHREAKRVKFNGTLIVSSELAHRYERLNNIRSNKNIIKNKRTRKDCGTSVRDR